MAVSQTTFEERVTRINKGLTVDAAAKVGLNGKSNRTLRARCLTFPFFVGVGILTGGAAVAFTGASPADIEWVMAIAG